MVDVLKTGYYGKIGDRMIEEDTIVMSEEELKEKYCSRCGNSDCDLKCIAKQEAPYGNFICNNGEMFEEYEE